MLECKFEKSTLKIFDDSHFYPHAGTYLDPGGQYLSYAGSIIIPFSYVLPRFVINNTDYFQGDEKITDIYYHILEHLREMVGIKTESRSKRIVLAIISILSGGLSVWNTVEIQGIKKTIELMHQNSQHLDMEIDLLSTSTNQIIDYLGHIALLVSDKSKTINSLSKRFKCKKRIDSLFHTFVENWLFSAPGEFLSA